MLKWLCFSTIENFFSGFNMGRLIGQKVIGHAQIRKSIDNLLVKLAIMKKFYFHTCSSFFDLQQDTNNSIFFIFFMKGPYNNTYTTVTVSIF